MGRDATFARNVEDRISAYMEGSSVHVRIVEGNAVVSMEDYTSPVASVLVMPPSAPLKAAPSMGIRLQDS